MDTPQPEIIYDRNPPTAVRQMKIEEVPIASIIEKPKSEVNIAIRNIPPPTPKSPDENPTKRPMIPAVIKLNGILASSLSLLMLMILLIAINKSRHPNIISKTLEGSADAAKPPFQAGLRDFSKVQVPSSALFEGVRKLEISPISSFFSVQNQLPLRGSQGFPGVP